jgi:CheY-like chemotaxis protein
MAARPTVLIAEDYSDFRARVVALLEPLAVDCIAVRNGREAIEVLQDLSQALHLLVTDLDMPVHHGWDVIEAAWAHRSGLPVIMQTGEANYPYVRRKAEELGIVLIHKPDVDVLLAPAVRVALGISAGA